MIGTLYRYPHPSDSSRFLYVGQGAKRDYQHRSEKTSFGRRFKKLFPDVELPQPIREEVEVRVALELNELETIWMFQYHTWCGYPEGMNLTFPNSMDYRTVGHDQGLVNALTGHMNRIRTFESSSKGGHIGGRKRVELHGNISTPESRIAGGRTAGRINGDKAVKLGLGIFAPGYDMNAARQIAGQKNVESGHAKRLGNSGEGLCYRWKIKRGLFCVCGKHETAGV